MPSRDPRSSPATAREIGSSPSSIDGTFKWLSPSLEAINWGAPSLADLDGDGTTEIVIGRQVLNADGTLRWTGTGGSGGGTAGPLSLVADIDVDGSPDVVAGNTVYSAAGVLRWLASVPDGRDAVGNFDDDPFAEIVVVGGGTVHLLEHDGSLKWGPVSLPGGGSGGPPTIADYDGDGEPEIGVAGASRYVVFETDGTIKWTSMTQDGSSSRTGSSVFDFDGDGSAEVVYRDELKLRVYRGTDGTILFEVPMSSCTWHEYVLVADVDADGNAEILAVANNNCGFGPQRGIFVYGDLNDSWVATRKLWNQHTYHITNINDDGSIPIAENDNWRYPAGSPYNNYRQNILTTASPLAAPDLTTSFIRFDLAACPETLGITARIGNGGSNVAAAPVQVAFYEGDPDAGGTLLGVVPTTRTLEPGEFEDVTGFFPSVGPVSRTYWVRADDDGSGGGLLSECNETNNACFAEARCEANQRPDCSRASAVASVLWPPNHHLVPVNIMGVTDPDGDPVTIVATAVTQDEPLNAIGDGNTCPDASVDEDGVAHVRRERQGPGNGRVYRISFVATDPSGASCEGSVAVCVPHDRSRKHPCVDDGQTVNSLGTCDGGSSSAWLESGDATSLGLLRFGGGEAVLRYFLTQDEDVELAVFDVTGRRVADLVRGRQARGVHEVTWRLGGLPKGV